MLTDLRPKSGMVGLTRILYIHYHIPDGVITLNISQAIYQRNDVSQCTDVHV